MEIYLAKRIIDEKLTYEEVFEKEFLRPFQEEVDTILLLSGFAYIIPEDRRPKEVK